MNRIVIVGAGYVGKVSAALLAATGAQVWAARRSTEAPPAGTHALRIDVADPTPPADWPTAVTHVLYAVAPGGSDEDAYRIGYHDGLRNIMRFCDPTTRVVLLSSTGVYGQEGGEWVTEASPRTATRPNVQWLKRAEDYLLTAPNSCVLRLGGIYGPERTRMIRIAASLAPDIQSIYTNRIHQVDAAAASVHCLLDPTVPRELLGVDEAPVVDEEVIAYLRARMGLPALAPTTKSPTGKRINSAALRASGFQFRYPSYREGYGALLDSASSR
jgi:nucleoside-diphosphate-sugar epimerase